MLCGGPDPGCTKCGGSGKLDTTTETNQVWTTSKPCDCTVLVEQAVRIAELDLPEEWWNVEPVLWEQT